MVQLLFLSQIRPMTADQQAFVAPDVQIEDQEEFRIIAGFDNYSVSNLGRVRNNTTQRILRPQIGGNGYYQVNLRNGGRTSTKKIHK
jgi:hypothetical protein